MRARAEKRSTSKGRKKKSSKAARGKTVKKKTRKSSISTVGTKKTARKRTAAATKKSAAGKTRRKSTRRSTSREVFGEGNYTASRDFREDETSFIRRNRKRIPAMAREAAAALNGPEGAELQSAEDAARAHSHSPGDER
jgi:hypothetical protein